MANLSALAITKAGRRVLAQAQTGEALRFTRVAAGDGILPEGTSVDEMTAMIRHVMDLPINSNRIIGDGTTKLEVILRNRYLETLFEFREVAISALNHELNAEILYAYSNSGDAPAAYIPAGNGPNAVNLKIGLITVVKQAQNIVVDISEDWGFLNREEWNEFLADFYGDYIEPPAFLWTADASKPKTLRGMPFGDIVRLLFAHTAPGNDDVVLMYNPAAQTVFGYPMSRLVVRSETIFGGDPSIDTGDYPDGSLDGGDPSMAEGDYQDGAVSGGDPYTY
jgi:hypothetical protein